MKTYSPAERQLLLSIAGLIIDRVVPDEVIFFQELADEYFLDPTPPEATLDPSDDPLASGLSEFLAPATPAALAMTSAALDYIRKKVPAEGSDKALGFTGIGNVLANQHAARELREQIYKTGRDFLLTDALSNQMTDELLAALRTLEAEAADPQRVINAWIDGLTPQQPLVRGQSYGLCFNVDAPRSDALAVGPAVDDLVSLLPADQEQVEVTVLLDSTGVLIHGQPHQTIIVPRTGPSTLVRFQIEPQEGGACTIQAFFLIGSQIFHQMKLQFAVSDTVQQSGSLHVYASGTPLEAALKQFPRRKTMSLFIMKRDAGYHMRLKSDTGVESAFVRISEAEINEMLIRARQTLHDIVNTVVGDKLIYQLADTTIPSEEGKRALGKLAEIGTYLFTKLFDSRDQDCRAIGERLRKLMASQQFYVDVIAEHFIFPWTMLYIGDDFTTPDPRLFWGFQHFVAYIPDFFNATIEQLDSDIRIDGQLLLRFVYNSTIDRHQQVVSRQRQFFRQWSQVRVSEHSERKHLLEILTHEALESHVIYCYCHAVSHLPGESGGVSNSRLILTDGPITLYELDLHASARKPPLARAPLVFLNACESAELSPYLYDGLVPYVIKRGARGVIGTEVDTPVFFAAEFAQELFSQWLPGELSLGEVILKLRRKYLFEKNNVLGLLYSLYVGSDLAIVWPRPRVDIKT